MPPTTRPRAVYCFECLCDRNLESEEKQIECLFCHREIRLVWPAEQASLETTKKEKGK